MSLRPILAPRLHGVADYGAALLLILVAVVIGGSGKAVGTGVAIGVVLLVVSLLTAYPLGVVKVIPFPLHSAGDYVGALVLIAAPFALNYVDAETKLTAFYVAVGVALIAISLITDYEGATTGVGTTRP